MRSFPPRARKAENPDSRASMKPLSLSIREVSRSRSNVRQSLRPVFVEDEPEHTHRRSIQVQAWRPVNWPIPVRRQALIRGYINPPSFALPGVPIFTASICCASGNRPVGAGRHKSGAGSNWHWCGSVSRPSRHQTVDSRSHAREHGR